MSQDQRPLRVAQAISESQAPLAAECTEAIRQGATVEHLTDSFPASQAYAIYDRRWRLQQRVTGSHIEGYEHVVSALLACDGSVSVGSVDTSDGTFTVFVRDGGSILGVLRSPHLRKAV